MVSLQRLYDDIWSKKSTDPCNSELGTGTRTATALGQLGTGKKLLDVGCGDGSFLAAALERYESVHGVDISRQAAAEARRRGLDVVLSDVNSDPLPFSSNVFDTVVSLDVIEHVIDPGPFVAELARVLEPGGTLLLSTPNIRYLKRVGELMFAGRFPRTSNDDIGFDGGHLHYFTVRDIFDLIRSAGCVPRDSIGVIPANKLRFLRPIANNRLICEFFSAGILVFGEKAAGGGTETKGG